MISVCFARVGTLTESEKLDLDEMMLNLSKYSGRGYGGAGGPWPPPTFC